MVDFNNLPDTIPEGTTVLSLDFETYSEVNLKTHGLDNYTAHPSFEVLMCAWRVNDEPVQMWLPSESLMPDRLRKMLRDPKVIKKAWNAQFERTVLRVGFDIVVPPSEWRCSMVRAMMLSLPGSLDEAGSVIGLGAAFAKSKEGKALIQLFCVPKKPTKKHPYTRYTAETHPEEWKRFVEYCRQDVVAECKIDRVLSKYEIPARMWTIYALDQKINDRGVPIDLPMIHNAIGMVQRRQNEIRAELAKITKLKNANSGQQFLPWARERGYPFDSLGKERIDRAFEDYGDSMSDECKTALKLRRSGAKGSVKKYAAFLKFVGQDGRLRFQFQFAGAGRTMRFAGRGVQLQNLKRPRKDHEAYLADIRQMIRDNDYEGLEIIFGDVMECLSSAIRSVIAPKAGRTLTVADLNAIETRLCGWVSGSEELARIFKRKECPYKHFAALLYRVPYADVTKPMRTIAKPAVLGCWYQLGGGREIGTYPDLVKTGLWAYAESMGVKLTQSEAKAQVDLFRSTYEEAKVMWAEINDAAIHTVQTGERSVAGMLSFDVKGPFLRMKLPSGRHIYYLRPKVTMQTIKHATGTFEKLGISYEGKNKVGKWGTVSTHGGKFVENVAQATAFDILGEGMIEADRIGFDIIMTVHDEIVAETAANDPVFTVPALCNSMTIKKPWRSNLILEAAGYADTFYKKD